MDYILPINILSTDIDKVNDALETLKAEIEEFYNQINNLRGTIQNENEFLKIIKKYSILLKIYENLCDLAYKYHKEDLNDLENIKMLILETITYIRERLEQVENEKILENMNSRKGPKIRF